MRTARRARDALAFALVFASADAHASSVDDHRALMIAGQVMRNNGRLLKAKQILGTCSSDACEADAPQCEEIRAYCKQKVAELEPEIPTLRVHVVDDRGLDVRDASVRVDTDVADATDAVPVDPGTHAIHAAYAGRSGSAEITIARGQKEMPVRVVVDLRREITRRPTRWYTWALGTVAGVASLTAIGFGIAAQAQADHLSWCAPTCDPSQKSLLFGTTITVDVALIVAATTALGAVFSYLLRPSVKRTIHVEQVIGGGT